MALEELRSGDSLKRIRMARHWYRDLSRRYQADLEYFLLSLARAPDLDEREILQPDQVAAFVDTELLQSPLSYLSGGFDLGMHHGMMMDIIDQYLPRGIRVLLGVEPNSYIEAKGRLPAFYPEDRLRTMARLLKKSGRLAGAVFLPDRNTGVTVSEHYDTLIRGWRIYRRPDVFHLWTAGDPAAHIKRDRNAESPPWCELPVIGRHRRMSTTDIIRDGAAD